MGSLIQMVASGSGGSESALASIDVPANGNLVGYSLHATADLDADSDAITFQISFGSTVSLVNDSRQIIGNARLFSVFTTSGHQNFSVNQYVSLPDIPVGMGERMYLHINAPASTASALFVVLHFDFNLDMPRSRLR